MSWTPERIATLRQLWPDLALTGKEIGRRMGVSSKVITCEARRLELPKRTAGPVRNCKVSDETILAALRAGDSAWRVKTTLGVHQDRIARLREAAGLGIKKSGKKSKPISREMHNAISDALIAGRGTRSIQTAFHISGLRVREIRDAMKAAGTEFNKLSGGRPRTNAAIVEFPMIRTSYQTVFDLIVVERPRPLAVLPAWVSRPIPPAKSCCWVTEGERKRQWIYCDAPVVRRGNPYCECHAAIAYVSQECAA